MLIYWLAYYLLLIEAMVHKFGLSYTIHNYGDVMRMT